MRFVVPCILVLLITGSAFAEQKTGDVLDDVITATGRAHGATAAEIEGFQNVFRNSVPSGLLDGGWRVVSPFDRIQVKPLPLERLDVPVTLVLDPLTAQYVDESKPGGIGASFRTYGFYLGRGLAGTMAAHLENYIGPTTVSTKAMPRNGLAVVPTLSDFKYKFVMADIVLQTIRVELNMPVRIYANGAEVASQTFRLDKYRGEKSFVAVNSGPVAENMVLTMAELVSRSMPFIHQEAQKHRGPQVIEIDMNLVVSAADNWDNFIALREEMTEVERGLAHYLMAIDRAYMDSNTDQQAELLSKLNAFVRRNQIEPRAREELIDQMRMRYRMREGQQTLRNEHEDAFYNFAGQNTDTVLTVASVVPDVAKVGLVIANPALGLALGSTAMVATDATAKFVGESSAEYFYGSGEVGKSLWAGAKTTLVDQAVGGAGKLIGRAGMAAGKAVGSLSRKAATSMGLSSAVSQQGTDVARYAAARVWGKRLAKAGAASAPAAAKTRDFLLTEGAQQAETALDEYAQLNYDNVTKALVGSTPQTTKLPAGARRIAGGHQ